MEDVIIIGILLLLIGAAAAYIIKAKKSGAKCIGCSASGSCPYKKSRDMGCQCGCGGGKDESESSTDKE